MRTLLPCLLLCFLTSPLLAKTRLEKQLEKKLASPFLAQGGWHSDYEQALAASKRSKKPLLAYFTASYFPCPPCLHLERKLFTSKEFLAWSKQVVLFCHVTSKVRGRAHDDLHARKGGLAFPYVTFLSPTGALRAEVIDPSKLGSFEKALGRVQRYRALLAKAATLPPPARAELLELEVEFMSLPSARAAEVGLRLRGQIPRAQWKRLHQALVELPKREQDERLLQRFYAAKLQTAADVRRRGPALGEAYWKLYQQGTRPHGARARELTYMFMWRYAAQAQHKPAGRAALKGLAGLGRRGKAFADSLRPQLEQWPDPQPASRPHKKPDPKPADPQPTSRPQ